jgi:hypothetical protein
VSIYKSSDPPPPALGHFFVPDPPPSSSSCPPLTPPSSCLTAAFRGAPVLCPHRNSPPPLGSRNLPSTEPPTPSPHHAGPPPSAPGTWRLPPRPAPASGAPHHFVLLPILLLRAILPGLRGSAAATRHAPRCPAGLRVVTSARASTSSVPLRCLVLLPLLSALRSFSPTSVRAHPPPCRRRTPALPPNFNWEFGTC